MPMGNQARADLGRGGSWTKGAVMKKLLLLGTMLVWGGAASAQSGGANPDQCGPSSVPAIQQTDVSTVERNSDTSGAIIQLDVGASLPNDGALTYLFSSADGTITGDGARATWTVSGEGPFTANVEVSSPDGCKSYAHFTYHMEQTAPASE
jgi:hypothetical protein